MAKSYPLWLAELTCTEYQISHQAPVMWLVSSVFYNFSLLTALKNKDAAANIARQIANNPEQAEKFWSLPLSQTASWFMNPQKVSSGLTSVTTQLAENNAANRIDANLTWQDFTNKCEGWQAVPHGAGKPSFTMLTLDGFYYDEFNVYGLPAKNALAQRGFYSINGQDGQQNNFVPVYERRSINGMLQQTDFLSPERLDDLRKMSREEAQERYGIYESPRAVKPQSAKKIAPPAIVNSTRPELNNSDPIHMPRQLKDALDEIARNFERRH